MKNMEWKTRKVKNDNTKGLPKIKANTSFIHHSSLPSVPKTFDPSGDIIVTAEKPVRNPINGWLIGLLVLATFIMMVMIFLINVQRDTIGVLQDQLRTYCSVGAPFHKEP